MSCLTFPDLKIISASSRKFLHKFQRKENMRAQIHMGNLNVTALRYKQWYENIFSLLLTAAEQVSD